MAEPTAHTEVPGGHTVFPPFDTQQFPSQLFWLSVTFLLLYVIVAKVALPRIGSIFEERSKRIGDDLAEAQRFKENRTRPMLHINSRSPTPTRTHNQL